MSRDVPLLHSMLTGCQAHLSSGYLRLSLWVRWLGLQAMDLLLVSRLEMELYLYFTIHHHVVVLNYADLQFYGLPF
jgi:hypothetical protein